jgi:hypothetical protein
MEVVPEKPVLEEMEVVGEDAKLEAQVHWAERQEAEAKLVVVMGEGVMEQEALMEVEEGEVEVKVNVDLHQNVLIGHQYVVNSATVRLQTSQMVTQMLVSVPLNQTVHNGRQLALSLDIVKLVEGEVVLLQKEEVQVVKRVGVEAL